MLLGRIVAALCHGSFFVIGSLVARSLVAPQKKSRAVAGMIAGLPVAHVLGVLGWTDATRTGPAPESDASRTTTTPHRRARPYIAYTFTEVSGFSSTDVAWLLMAYGVGLVVHHLIGGRGADHDRDRTLILALRPTSATPTRQHTATETEETIRRP